MLKKTFCLICIAASALVFAQTPSAFLGSWTVTWQGDRRPQQARLVITESGGTWKTAASSRTDNCVGKEVPIALEVVNGDEATVRLKFSQALHGCTDVLIKIRKLSENALTGKRGQAELTISRE